MWVLNGVFFVSFRLIPLVGTSKSFVQKCSVSIFAKVPRFMALSG